MMRWGQFDEMMRSEMKLYVQRQGSRALNASCSDQVSFVGIRVCVCACVCVCVCVSCDHDPHDSLACMCIRAST